MNATVYGEKEGFVVPEKVGLITEDHNGLIWIGTENGLYSFNGTQFKNYRHASTDSNSLPANNVFYNYEDRQGIYWAFVPSSGLYNYDPKTESFRKYHYKNEKEFNINEYYKVQVGLPFEDSHNRMWLPLPGYGLAEIDRKNNVLRPYKICFPGDCGGYYDPSWVTRIIEDKNKYQFLLATNGGLVSFNPATGNVYLIEEKGIWEKIKKNTHTTELNGQQNVFNFFGPQYGNDIWVGTWGDGIKKFNVKTKTFETFRWAPKKWDGTSNVCGGIWVKDSTHLWVTTYDAGVYIFDLAKKIFQPVKFSESLQPFTNGTSFSSSDGTVWLWQTPTALVKLDNKNLFTRYHFSAPTIDPVNCFVVVENHLFLCNEFSNGIYEYDNAKQVAVYYPLPGKGSRNISFMLAYPEKKGIYVGGIFGLLFFNLNTKKFEPVATDTTTKRMLNHFWLCAKRTTDGSIWLGGYTDHLVNVNPSGGTTKSYDLRQHLPTGLINIIISELAEDNNHLWFASNPQGLGCLDKQTGKATFFNVYRNKTYPAGQSTSICLKDSSVFFTVLGDGLWQLKNPFTNRETCINHTEKDGLPANWVRYIMPGEKHTVLLYSTKGISLFDVETHTIKNFSEPEGLQSKNVYERPWTDSTGMVYIGMANGFQTFNPSTLAKDSVAAFKTIINDFKVNGKSFHDNINYYKALTLKPYENNISFEFAAVTHGNPRALNYAYKLENFDRNWIPTGNETKGNYNNLPAGNYTLRIKLLGHSENADNTFSMPLVVQPYWYNTDWFRALIAVAVVVLLYAFYRYRINNLKRENVLKSSFDKKMAEVEMRALRAQMNPHFIFNCLTSINRYIVKSDHKTASNYLTKFSKLIRMILDNSASDHIFLETEIQTLQLYMDMELLRFDDAFAYEIETGETLDIANIRIPSMLVQPYIENAIWHGLLHKETKGKLYVRFIHEKDNILKVEIEDDGIGRTKARELRSKDVIKNKSYGMQISRDRIKLINSLYNIETSVQVNDLVDPEGNAAGTRIIIEIPFLQN